MKRYLIALVLEIGFGYVNAQNVTLVDYDVNPGQYIKEIKLPSAPTKGNYYLDNNWIIGDFTMKGSINLKGQLLRYDLKHNNLEIKLSTEVKVCPLDRLENFTLFAANGDSLNYMNINSIPSYYKISDRGIVEVLYKGSKSILYLFNVLDIKKANYVPTVDMGSKSDKLIKRETYYLQTSGKLYKLEDSLEKNENIFGKDYSKIKEYSKSNKLKIKHRSDLIKILGYYESL